MAKEREARSARVRLYALSTCPKCSRIKKFLKAHGVECQVIDVDLLDSGEQWVKSKELKAYNPRVTYPTLVIERVITEFEEEKMKEALGIE